MDNASAVTADFEFYAWIVRAGFLMREPLTKQLTRLGLDDCEAFIVARYDAAKANDLIEFYQDWGMHNPALWSAFILDCRAQYDAITPQHK